LEGNNVGFLSASRVRLVQVSEEDAPDTDRFRQKSVADEFVQALCLVGHSCLPTGGGRPGRRF
jgi:hypothetical protein